MATLLSRRKCHLTARSKGCDGTVRREASRPKTARRAGIGKTVTPRTLRHAFITAALDAGVPLRDVQEAASHADPRTTMRYDHQSGLAAAWTGMRPTSSPPTSQAPPGNGTPNWRSFARQWQRPGEAAHTIRPSRTATPGRTHANRRSVRVGQGRARWRDAYRTGSSMQRPVGPGRTFRRWLRLGSDRSKPDAGYVKILG